MIVTGHVMRTPAIRSTAVRTATAMCVAGMRARGVGCVRTAHLRCVRALRVAIVRTARSASLVRRTRTVRATARRTRLLRVLSLTMRNRSRRKHSGTEHRDGECGDTNKLSNVHGWSSRGRALACRPTANVSETSCPSSLSAHRTPTTDARTGRMRRVTRARPTTAARGVATVIQSSRPQTRTGPLDRRTAFVSIRPGPT